MNDDRDKDKIHKIYPQRGPNVPRLVSSEGVSLDVIKSMFIASGLTVKEISEKTFLPVDKIEEIVNQHNLVELRKSYIVEGIREIQNTQIQQSNQLLDLENNFKKLRILQLEKELADYIAYYSRHGHFYKMHPLTGEILKDTYGIPMQIKIPNVSREIATLKESVTMGEGVRQLLTRIDDIINTGVKKEIATEIPKNVVDAEFSELFKDVDTQDE